MRACSLLRRAASRSRTAGSASNMRRMLRKVLRSRRQGWATKVELSARAAPICGWAASSTVARIMANAQRGSSKKARNCDSGPNRVPHRLSRWFRSS